MRLDGKVAVITGAASGIGAASARRFVEEGCRVVLGDIQQERGDALVAELGSHSRRVRDGLFQLTRTLDAKDLDVSRFCQGQLKIAYEALAQAEALEQTSKTDAKELQLLLFKFLLLLYQPNLVVGQLLKL